MLRNWRQTNLNLEESNYLNNVNYSTDLSIKKEVYTFNIRIRNKIMILNINIKYIK